MFRKTEKERERGEGMEEREKARVHAKGEQVHKMHARHLKTRLHPLLTCRLCGYVLRLQNYFPVLIFGGFLAMRIESRCFGQRYGDPLVSQILQK